MQKDYLTIVKVEI